MYCVLGSVFVDKPVIVGLRGNIIFWRRVVRREVLTGQTFTLATNADGAKFLTAPDDRPFDELDVVLLWCNTDDMANTPIIFVRAAFMLDLQQYAIQ